MLSFYSTVIIKVVLIAVFVQLVLMQDNEGIGMNPVGQVSGQVGGQDQFRQIHPRSQLIRKKRGFGCYGPFDKNEYKCNAHCKSNGVKIIRIRLI